MIIGTFTQIDGGFTGTLKTLSVEQKLHFRQVDNGGENSPDYRVQAGASEIGAGWSRTSKAGNAYVSVRIDDPAFPNPLNANLIAGKDGKYLLIWER